MSHFGGLGLNLKLGSTVLLVGVVCFVFQS